MKKYYPIIVFLALVTLGSGYMIISHSSLADLDADDHPQYHNDTRGDARYFTETEVDSILLNLEDIINAKFAGFQMQLNSGDAIAGQILYPTTNDTVMALWASSVKRIDSITVYVDDSVTVQGKFGDYGYGTTIFTSPQLITSYSTLTTFNNNVMPENDQLALYFTALGDGVNFVRWLIYMSPDSSNLIINSINYDFEGSLGYWTGDYKLTSSDTSSEQASVGTYSMKLVSDGTGTGSIILNNALDSVITKSTGTVLLTADVYSDKVGQRLRIKDDTGNLNFTTANTTANTWQSVSCYATGTFTGVSALAVIVVDESIVYIDNIIITEQ